MDSNDVTKIEGIIGYRFKKKDLLLQALTRRSYAVEYGGGDNEILEHIGDKALDLVVIKYLTDKYGYYAHECDDYQADEYDDYYCEYDEGELTKLKSKLVQRKALAHRIDLLKLADYLFMGETDIRNLANQKEAVKEDLFEAIIGAVVLDTGWNMKVVADVILNNMLQPDADMDEGADCENYIALIQKWAMKRYGELPQYNVVEGFETGKDMFPMLSVTSGPINLDKKFMAGIKLPGIKYWLVLKTDNGKDARMEIAREAYKYLEREGLLLTIRDEISEPTIAEAINQLEILSRRGYFKLPEYDFKDSFDVNGNQIWTVKCSISDLEYYFEASASSKKQAKKEAAYSLLVYVLDNYEEER